uniref:Cytochrome P450 n=1 Tax=Strigamia maritima TaxID=126957 RepID=T1J9R2_STRMM
MNKYNTWHFDYWARQGVPGSKPRLLSGTLLPTWKYGFDEQDVIAIKKFGKIYGGFVGRSPVLFVSDPELLKQILVKDFATFPNRRTFGLEKDELMGNMLQMAKGEKWKMLRNTLTPTYTSGKLKQMVGLIEECLENLKTSLKIPAETGEPIEFTKKFPVLTLDVIASVAFGMKINCIDNPNTDFVVNAQKAFRGNSVLTYFLCKYATILKLSFIVPFTRKDFLQIMLEAEIPNDPTKENQPTETDQKKLSKTGQTRHAVVYEGIWLAHTAHRERSANAGRQNHHRKEGSRRTHRPLFSCLKSRAAFISLILADHEFHKNRKTMGQALSREIVVAQTILFILAGHESTANTLNFLAYELAQNQDVQEKLIKEVDEVMTHSKGKLLYEGVASMQYLDMVTLETLRKYPPGIRLDRVCEDDEYKLNGITIRKGMPIIIPAYAMHHNPEFYPNPNIFDPERFSPEMKANRNPFTYLPFGAGPRNCIAKRFALLEAKLVIVHMLYNYRFHTCPETEYPLKMNKGWGLLQPLSVKLVLQKRVDKPNLDETLTTNSYISFFACLEASMFGSNLISIAWFAIVAKAKIRQNLPIRYSVKILNNSEPDIRNQNIEISKYPNTEYFYFQPDYRTPNPNPDIRWCSTNLSLTVSKELKSDSIVTNDLHRIFEENSISAPPCLFVYLRPYSSHSRSGIVFISVYTLTYFHVGLNVPINRITTIYIESMSRHVQSKKKD